MATRELRRPDFRAAVAPVLAGYLRGEHLRTYTILLGSAVNPTGTTCDACLRIAFSNDLWTADYYLLLPNHTQETRCICTRQFLSVALRKLLDDMTPHLAGELSEDGIVAWRIIEETLAEHERHISGLGLPRSQP